MINLRKTKYIVITDGLADTTVANVIACDDIYEAQEVFKKAIDDCLNPAIMESARYIDDSLGDRYAQSTSSSDLYRKIKENKEAVLTPQKTRKETLRKIITRDI